MSVRYSGVVTIRITYRDASTSDVYPDGTPRNFNGTYRCVLSRPKPQGSRTKTYRHVVIVGAPAFLSHAVDSVQAFDDAARAALSFGSHDDSDWGENAWQTDSGWHVGRSKNDAYAGDPREVTILSIDAWNGPDGWTWNQWYNRGKAPLSLCEKKPRAVFAWMRENGFLSEGSKGRVALDDDQHNLVIIDRHTREPLFAIAYGEADHEEIPAEKSVNPG